MHQGILSTWLQRVKEYFEGFAGIDMCSDENLLEKTFFFFMNKDKVVSLIKYVLSFTMSVVCDLISLTQKPE